MNMIDKKQEKHLVRHFQRTYPSQLAPDGDLGPKTRHTLVMSELFERVQDRFAGTGYNRMCILFMLAKHHVGKGGDGKRNNHGAFLDNMRRDCGFPPRNGAWCAVYASWELLYEFGRVLVLSRGARALVRNVAKFNSPQQRLGGVTITNIARNAPDDFLGIASYGKGSNGVGMGHVRFIGRLDGQLFYIGGNETREDKVCWGLLTHAEFEDKLLQVATIVPA